MNEFRWHIMADEMPEKGKKDYLVMGVKGGLYLAPRFEGYGERGDDVWFRDTRGNFHYPDKVLAWAEVPKLEDGDAQESENAKLRELVKNLRACNGSCPRCIELMGKCEYEEQLAECGIKVDG